jgi:predicted Zn-dependent protease
MILRVTRGVLASIILLLCGCTSTKSVAPLNVALEEDYIPLQEEVWAIAQADSLHETLLSKGMVVKDEQADALFLTVKHRLLKDQPQIAEHIRIYLLRSPDANAAALPNGIIYIHAGLFPILDNEDQLAAIIGHEIAHVVDRHSLRAVINQKNTFIGAHVADLMTGGLGLVYFPALASLSSFSREQEEEADMQAVIWLQAAGYQPEAAIEVFRNFTTIPGAQHNQASIYSSHPSQQQRIASLEQQLSVKEATPSPSPDLSPEFLAVRVTQTEAVVEMHLRDHRYILAETDLDRIAGNLPQQSRVEYYRGEIDFGRARNPGDATREAYWIQSGKTNFSSANYALFENQKDQNLQQAVLHYNLAANGEPQQVNAMKRLGEVYLYQGDNQEAVNWLRRYLNTAPDAGDERYVNSLIKKAQNTNTRKEIES